MSGHTPGPWFCDGRLPGSSEHAVFASEGVACVARVQPGCLPAEGREDAAAANARLVAAAPELLSALRWLRAFWNPGSDHDTDEVQLALAEADAALSKASPR